MITTTSLPNAVYQVPYRATIIASGGTAPYTFTISSGTLPFGLSLSRSGVISGKPTQRGQISNFVVQVTDSSNPLQTATVNFSITVFNSLASLAITTTSLPNGETAQVAGQKGTAYKATVMAIGGTKPYSFAVISGSLPAGLSMNARGAISGTPSGSNGTSNFTVQVADSSVPIQTVTANLSITISGNFIITTLRVPNGRVGVPYSTQIMTSGGTPPFLFAVGEALPTGLSLSETGVISGTPTKATHGPVQFGCLRMMPAIFYSRQMAGRI